MSRREQGKPAPVVCQAPTAPLRDFWPWIDRPLQEVRNLLNVSQARCEGPGRHPLAHAERIARGRQQTHPIASDGVLNQE